MVRRFWQLLRWMLPALIIAAASWYWWLFYDGPVKVSRPPKPIHIGYAVRPGPTGRTVLERETRSDDVRSLFWRDLESGRFIIPPGELNNVWAYISENEETLIVTTQLQPDHPGGIKLYNRSTSRMTELPDCKTGWDEAIDYAGNRLAYEAIDESVIVVNLDSHKVTHRLRDLHPPLKLCPDGRFLVAPTDETTVVMRDLDTGREFVRP